MLRLEDDIYSVSDDILARKSSRNRRLWWIHMRGQNRRVAWIEYKSEWREAFLSMVDGQSVNMGELQLLCDFMQQLEHVEASVPEADL